jgi:hypothetical protein
MAPLASQLLAAAMHVAFKKFGAVCGWHWLPIVPSSVRYLAPEHSLPESRRRDDTADADADVARPQYSSLVVPRVTGK